jgi:hypothetical protein
MRPSFDDRIIKISTDPHRWETELPPQHACARIERAYHPDRLKVEPQLTRRER